MPLKIYFYVAASGNVRDFEVYVINILKESEGKLEKREILTREI